MPEVNDPRLIVGTETRDDAAVWRLDEDRALVATTDFFTPVVDDPYTFGQIAAANALSDVYAMGGKPLFALNVLGFPYEELDKEIMAAILRGGADKAREAGIPIAGGHSVDDKEPKYGLVVIGEVHPEAVWGNGGAQPGDLLVLTKPLGVGVLTTAIKRGLASASELEAVVECMVELNRDAARAAQALEADGAIHAATDVTGYGLLGHLREMVEASPGVRATIYASKVPVLSGARAHAEAGAVPGGSRKNEEFVGEVVDYDPGVDGVTRSLLCDAQTSGGLLFAVHPDEAASLIASLEAAGTLAAVEIGSFEAAAAGILVLP